MKQKNKLFKKIRIVLPILIVAYVVFILIFSLYARNNYKSYIETSSAMTPTILKGQTVKTKTKVSSVNRGAIVVFNAPNNYGVIIERVVAVAGERIVIDHGTVTIYNSTTPNGINPDST